MNAKTLSKTPWRPTRNLVLALCAVAGFGGCTQTAPTQVITGRVSTAGAIAVRAVSDDTVITAGQVRSDGSFTLSLPAGKQYRLEVLTTTGVRPMLTRSGQTFTNLAFRVCQPADPWNCGGIGDPGSMTGSGAGPDGMCADPTDPNCKPTPEPCDPNTTNCEPAPPPPPCADPMDPNCKPTPCDVGTMGCEPPPPPCADPTDPNCGPGCDPMTGNCEPPPPPTCMDPTDPAGPNGMPGPGGDCKPPSPCDADGSCPPSMCTDPTDLNCPPPPPPCADPSDPETCKDPCVDPMSCGCASDVPECWPVPNPAPCDANGVCDPDGTVTPDFPPGDFGCDDGMAL